MRSPLALARVLVLLFAQSCGSAGSPPVVPTPTPSPSPAGGVTPGDHSGPTEITFVAADPPPGTTLAGCGPNAVGCSGRVRMRFRLLSASGGPVLDAIGFLHATNQVACYRGATGPFDLRAGAPTEVTIVFDQPDAVCGVPNTIAHMKLVLNAPVQTAGLQEWAVTYALQP